MKMRTLAGVVTSLLIALTLVGIAHRAPDEDHPYGHEKFETLGTLAVVGFLSISCFELLREATQQLLRRTAPPHPGNLGVVLLVGTAGVNAFVVWYERRRGRSLGSAFLLADAAHTSSDLYVTVLAIVSLCLARVGLGGFDAPIAILVARGSRLATRADGASFASPTHDSALVGP